MEPPIPESPSVAKSTGPPSRSAEEKARRYRQILDSLTDMVFCKSAGYRVTFANRAAQEYYGLSEDELWGVTDVPYNEAEFTQQYLRDDRTVFETGQAVVRPEEPNVSPDGTVHYFQTVKTPIFDESGRVVELVGVSRDITELRKEREETERRQTHLELAIEAGRLGTWEWDIPGQQVFWSPQQETVFGLPEGSFEGTLEAYETLIHPEDREAAREAVRRALESRSAAHHVLHRVRTPSGEVRWVESHGRFVYGEDGSPLRLVGVSVDVTRNIAAEEALRHRAEAMEASRAELLRIFEQAPAVISVTEGPDHVISYQNPRSKALLGGRDLIGKRVVDVFPEAEVRQFEELQDEVYRTGEPYVGTETPVVLDLDGDGVPEERFFNFTYQPLRGPDGDVYGIMSHAVEVTDQVRARQAVEEKAAELARLTRALEQSNRDLDQFAYVASHDLKAPLRGIASLAQWLEEDLAAVLPEESRRHLILLKGRAQRMEALIEGVLTYSRATRRRERVETVEVEALVRETIDLLAAPGVQFHVADDLPTLVTERVPLQQIFLNLIGNGIKHAKREDPEIWVTWRNLGERVEFTVRDNGPGIPEEFQERIWGIFQTLEARDEVEGTGIGLAVVKKLVDLRGGEVGVRSAAGTGASFWFTWPSETAPA